MAERRMMAKSIIKSDQFLEMPISSQLLYFHLLLDADDDGFINAPKSIMRVIGAKDDDMRVLQAKGYTIPFDSGVIVIKHWRMHNSLRKDRYNPNPQLENERKQLIINDRKEYELATTWQPTGNQLATNGYHSIGKDSIGKDSVYSGCDKSQPTRTHFTPPTLEEVKAYCIERNNNIDAEYFIDFQEARGWVLSNGKKMKDWKATIRTWEKNNYNRKPVNKSSKDNAINVVNNLMDKLGGDSNEQSTTDTESTIDVTASVHY
nr:MAG TPA: replisome organizer [Caudoviricetes sp.]